jgi:hypothetical protein
MNWGMKVRNGFVVDVIGPVAGFVKYVKEPACTWRRIFLTARAV